MDLKQQYGGMIAQASQLLGNGAGFDDAAMTEKLEELKSVIDEIIEQFKNPVSIKE